MPRTEDLGTSFENRRGEVERINNTGAQYFVVSGEVEVDGVGNASANVIFPVLFTSKPRFHYGHELVPGQQVVLGNFPECSVTVTSWDFSVRDDGSNLYSGANFGIVTYGPTTQTMIIQWHMDGVGLRGPVPDLDNAD